MSLKIFLATYILTGLAMFEITILTMGFQRKIKPILRCSAILGFVRDLLRLRFELVLDYIVILSLWPISCALAWNIQEEIFKDFE